MSDKITVRPNGRRLFDAVERNIEIIGEAMNRILKEDGSIEITNSRKIVDVRNRIIHGYDSVSQKKNTYRNSSISV
nr:HepT-like ribonuclease domain-containing protein [Proteiniphilum acetatigenes]